MKKSLAPEDFDLTGETIAEGRERVKRQEAEREAREKKQIADRERDLFALQPTERAPRPEPKTASLFEERLVKGTDKELESVKAVADKYGGEIAYFDPSRKLGLVRGYASLSGQPVYLMVLGNNHTLVDVDSVTNASFLPYKAEMSDLIKRLEQDADQRHQVRRADDGHQGIRHPGHLAERCFGMAEGEEEHPRGSHRHHHG
jgi:hypothetical protein